MRTTFQTAASVFIGAIILMTPALLNNFPFLYPDTGTYLVCAFNDEVSELRPVTYGLFMRHTSLMESFWFVVFVQAIIVSWTVHAFSFAFFKNLPRITPFVIIIVLTLMTGLGEVTGMLMPDFLTPVMILSMAILLFGELKISWKIISCLLLWFSVACHHSNPYTSFFLLIIFLFAGLIYYWKYKITLFNYRRFILSMFLVIAGFFTIPTLHWYCSGEFYWSKAKSIFITNRINQMGLLTPYLQKHCKDDNFKLCVAKDSIPYDFLWDSNSPLNKTGGWTANDEAYSFMLKDFFKQPYFARKFIIKTIENGVIQFFTIEGRLFGPEREGGYVGDVIKRLWPETIPSIKRSMQYADLWSSKTLQVFQRFLFYGSLLLFGLVFIFGYGNKISRNHKAIAVFILLGVLMNAFICAGISMVDMRFQYRVAWLIPFITILILADQIWSWKLSRKTIVEEDSDQANPVR